MMISPHQMNLMEMGHKLPSVEAQLATEREKVRVLREAASRVLSATDKAKKVYGGTLSFEAVCELDKLRDMLAATPEVRE